MAELTRSQRREERLRQLLLLLKRYPQGKSWQEAWSAVTEVVPAVGEDLEKTASGQVKGETDVRWYLTNLDKAGWILTGQNLLRITESGREALQQYPDGAALLAASNTAYKAWEALRDAARQAPATGDVEAGLLPGEKGEAAVRQVARRILQEGLRVGGSSFAPGRPVWAEQTVHELRSAFIDQPDLGGDSFEVKLKRQLANASDDARLLVAEILALQVLPLADLKVDTKRARVKSVLALMERPVGMPADVNAAMDAAIFSGGMTFKTLIWRSLATGIEVAASWWRLDDEGRDRAWSDPWAWRDLVEAAQGDSTIPSARAELRYLAHPDTFLPIISSRHHQLIRDAFAQETGVAPSEDLQRDLYAITMELQRRGGAGVDYYAPGLHEKWAAKPAVTDELSTTQAGPVGRAWLVRGDSVLGQDLVPTWITEGSVTLSASRLPPLALPVAPEELRQAVEEGFAHLSYTKREEKYREISTFVTRMGVHDLLLTVSAGRAFPGRITGPASYTGGEHGLGHLRRPASWITAGEGVELEDLPVELASRLKAGNEVADLTDVAALVEELTQAMQEDPADVSTEARTALTLPPVPQETADELLVGRGWLDELVQRLDRKGQVILHGPPGTGKTFLAQKVAEAIAPPQNVKLVQFHPSYSYEDFFEGYRPVPLEGNQIGFKLKAGPFRRIVEDAKERPQEPFILIIDEINRANLARVFGELYFLLEYRDAAIDLLYRQEEDPEFQLPRNVFIIGTMNTADRSIALVDAAMRRRFAFLSLHPGDEHLKAVLPTWLEQHDLPPEPAELLGLLNERVPDQELAIGPSYLMRREVGSPGGLEVIWRTEILPLLAEYHAGEGLDVKQRYGLAALRAELTRRATTEEQAEEDEP